MIFHVTVFLNHFLQTNPDKKMRANASLQDTSRFGNRSPARATIHDVDVREPQHPKICTSLRQLDLLWREREALKPPEARETVTRRIESEESFRKRSSIELDPQFREAGIVHRLPRWDNFVRKESKSFGREIYLFDPPRTRHSDGTTYAEFCSRLMNCLQGRARLFTKCEFFYSDLDRAW